MGSACMGISITTLKSLARSRPASTRFRLMVCVFLCNFGRLVGEYYPSWRFDWQNCGEMNRTLPLILTLDQHGVPHRWVTWQQAVWYYAKERIAWELGREAFTVWGGRCHR